MPIFGDYDQTKIDCHVVNEESCNRLSRALAENIGDTDLGRVELGALQTCALFSSRVAKGYSDYLGAGDATGAATF